VIRYHELSYDAMSFRSMKDKKKPYKKKPEVKKAPPDEKIQFSETEFGGWPDIDFKKNLGCG
jgi:hypothetical protein